MKITERLVSDKEIQELKRRLYEITGQNLGFNYDCYLSIDEYKDHLRECVEARKIIVRPKDITTAHRFDVIKRDHNTTSN